MKLFEPQSMPEEKTDMLLRRYFRAEMPQPWPAYSFPRQNGASARPVVSGRQPRAWLGRIALAASVALFFVGYLALARFFPETSVSAPAPSASTKPKDLNKNLAHNPNKVVFFDPPKKVTTPRGNEVIMKEGFIPQGDLPKLLQFDFHVPGKIK